MTTKKRPPEFDRRLLDYTPALRKLSGKYRQTTYGREELVSSTIAHCLGNWENFREDGGFFLWISWQMRSVHSSEVRKLRNCNPHIVDIDSDTVERIVDHMHGGQYYSVLLSEVLSKLGGRNGEILLKHAKGVSLSKLMKEYGLSRAAIHKIKKQVRDELKHTFGELECS